MMVENALDCSQDFGMSPGALPQWKRELLLRRAARARPPSAPSPAGPPPPPPPPPPADEAEELRYGPGIVKRLKSRYLSLALRDAPRRRPSVLRRAASLEHLDERPAPRPRPAKPPRPADLAPQAPRAPPLSSSCRRDSIKRARSVDALSRLEPRDSPPAAPLPAGTARPGRPPRRPPPLLREAERPPPDVVRSTLRKFEPAPGRRAPLPAPRSPSPAGAAAPRAVCRAALERIGRAGCTTRYAFEAARRGSHLPLSAANPVLLMGRAPRRVGVIRPMPPPPPPQPAGGDAGDDDVKHTTVTAPGPECLSPVIVSPPPPHSPLETVPWIVTETSPKITDALPKIECIPAEDPPCAPPPPPPPVQTLPPPPSPLPRRECHVEPTPRSPPPLPKSPPPESSSCIAPCLPASSPVVRPTTPPSITKPVTPSPVVRPVISSPVVRPSTPPPFVRPVTPPPPVAVRAATPPPSPRPVPAVNGSGPLPGLRPRGSRSSQPVSTSVVFNFSSRKEVPDYIENDGLILRNRRDRLKPGSPGVVLLRGSGGTGTSGGGDGDSDEGEGAEEADCGRVSPCDVRFLNDNVIINGRSSMPGRPNKDRILKLKLQFDDSLTRTFEYPSEMSLCDDGDGDDDDHRHRGGDDDVTCPAPAPPAHNASLAPLAANTHIVSASLSRYTPCKSSAAAFSLGLARAAVQQPEVNGAANGNGNRNGNGNGLVAEECGAECARSWSDARALNTDLLF